MSINDLVDSIEQVARLAVLEAKAVYVCEFHPDATITNGDPEADRLAYAIATNKLKREDEMFMREEVMEAVKYELDMANDECAQCARHRDD
ncbi:hypothetical protein [Mesorhizobium sp. M0159]|uniref:hypothetical protein n=1 Tax=Mesorhizobium sp. M0159 TaxID=2956900 RepID=UPI00333E0A84